MGVGRDLRLGDFLIESLARAILCDEFSRPHRSDAVRLAEHEGKQLERGAGCQTWAGSAACLIGVGSASLMGDVTDMLVDDLIRRAELLQGAMVLIRNDSVI